MLFFRIILVFLVILVQAVNAVQVLGVLEIVPKDGVDDISVDEIRHLTDELRRQATNVLPQSGYSILTRDNIIALIPPDEKEADCLAESCAVDIGRAIGVEYVTNGGIGKFRDEYSLSIELYETMSGKLLGSIVMESADVKGLLIAIRTEAPGLFAKMPLPVTPLSEPEFTEFKNFQNEKKDTIVEVLPISNPEPLVPIPPKSSIPKYVAFSLDILGAVAVGFGVYQHFQKEKFYKEYKDMPVHLSSKEYVDAYDKSEDARKMRDIGFVIGGVLLSSGIAVHIFF